MPERAADRDSPSAYRLAMDADGALGRRDYRTAAALYAKALDDRSIRPFLRAAMLANLGLAWQQLGETGKAIDCFERAAATNPKLAAAQLGLANMLALRGRHAEALERCDEALRLDASSAIAHTNRALSLEALGRLEEAWAELEWRYGIPTASAFYPHRYTKPRWNGESLQGRTLLVHREQGLGDVIQYSRFLPRLARFGVRVTFECPAALLPLASSLSGVRAFASRPDPVPEEAFDCYVPLLSLPRVLGFRAVDLPATCPYLAAPAPQENPFLARWGQGSRIGFVWSGSAFDPERNATLADFLPLLALDARLLSLQKEPSESEKRELSEHGIEDVGSGFRDFGDTRDAIAALDAVVAVDTAVAHLAGALGKPVWLLLSEPAATRWMTDRADSPWYPTMRIRRRGGESWPETVARLAAEITQPREGAA